MEKTDEINRSAKLSKLMGFQVDISNIQTEVAQCNAINSEYSYIYKGAMPYESVYEEYLKKLKDAGIEKIKDEVQRQINEWVANKDK